MVIENEIKKEWGREKTNAHDGGGEHAKSGQRQSERRSEDSVWFRRKS